MRPHPLVARAYLGRGARLWLGVRAVLTAFLLVAGADPTRLPFGAAVEVAALTVGVCFVGTFRHREWTLLGDLGVRPLTIGALFAVPALLGEIAIRALVP